jgi:O-methyltransferase
MRSMQILKDLIRAGLERCGYQIIRADPPPRPTEESPYGAVFPSANYCPWAADRQFLQAYEIVRDYTLVDILRCYELWTLVDQVSKLEGDLLEVGAWRGGSGALIARRAELSQIRSSVYLCDTFEGVVKASWRDSVYRGGEHGDASRSDVESLISRLGLRNVTIHQGVFPNSTPEALREGRLRFCHIDVDVYESANDILSWVWPRLVRGGIVVYDDYGFQSCNGITQHVEDQRSLPDRLFIHNLNGHAILIKLS